MLFKELDVSLSYFILNKLETLRNLQTPIRPLKGSFELSITNAISHCAASFR